MEDVVETQPKKRGRPRKIVEAAPVRPIPQDAEATSEPIEKPKRGRKPKAAAAPNAEKLAKQLMGAHLIASQFVGIDLSIDKDEAQLLADATIALASEYDIRLSGKAAAWFGLLSAAALVYGPRVPAIVNKVKSARGQKRGIAHAIADSTTG